MKPEQRNSLEKLMKDYYNTETKAVPELQKPRFTVNRKNRRTSWIPALAFNLLLAASAVFFGLTSAGVENPLEHKISALNTTYGIEKRINKGLYALKTSYTIWRNK
jgi:hypothetical protein